VTLDDQTNAPLPTLPPRAPNSHKGDYGHALLIGGSRGMAGAIALAGRATVRSGAGLVTIATPDCCQDLVASFEPSYMTHGLPTHSGQIATTAINEIVELADKSTVVALGPGVGRSSFLNQVVADLYRNIKKPMVVDADALFALATSTDVLSQPGGPRVLTPHPGEFKRLTRSQVTESDRVEAAAALAGRDATGQTIVLLKGRGTVVTDGSRFSINTTGNPGMATGGTGDALTGVITGLLCQGLSPFDAARLGAYVHGTAGDMAAEAFGEVSLIASDLVELLPMAFQSINAPS
jgi:ADP-dependent NAD(P)H-hydrate dehydratase